MIGPTVTGYQALYRKYRPQTFKELAGQDPIAETLRNEVRDGRLAHAYLFTGPRGTGKTTSARLLAKALNCQHGPTADPCPEEGDDGLPRNVERTDWQGECQQCRAIRLGAHMDVIEIDAASNRGIDDIRSLQERVQLAPVQGRYKVFIIDEVHMLTDPAWNALLKTLEEPPDRCIFVMATTEVHKVLATVLSRCQRFDFQRISRGALVDRLRFVAGRESIEIDDEALDIIARRSDGGLRDALSLLDQVSATHKVITGAVVYDALGMLPADQVLDLGRRIADRDSVGALQIAYDLLAAGHDHRTILRELLGWVRNLLLLQLAPDKAIELDVPQAQAADLVRQMGNFSQADLLGAMEILRETDNALRGSNQMTIWLEVGLLRLCDRTSVASLSDLARRVTDLEARLASGAVPATSQLPAARPAVAAAQPALRPAAAPAGLPAPAAHAPPGPPAQASPAPSAQASPAPTAQAPLGPPAQAPLAPPAQAPLAPPAQASAPGSQATPAPAAQASPARAAQASPAPAAPHAGGGDRDVYRELVARLEQVGPKSKSEAFKQMVLGATLKHDGVLLLRTKKGSFYKEGTDHRRFVQDNARALFGSDIRVELTEDTGPARPAARPTASSASPSPVAAAPASLATLAPVSPAASAIVLPSAPPPATAPAPDNAPPAPIPPDAAAPTGAAASTPSPATPPAAPQPSNGHYSGDTVSLAADIFLGKIVEGH